MWELLSLSRLSSFSSSNRLCAYAMRNSAGSLRFRLAAAFLLALPLTALGAERPIRAAALKQGSEFTSPDVRAMQADDFANPAMLWVTRGERLWREASGT